MPIQVCQLRKDAAISAAWVITEECATDKDTLKVLCKTRYHAQRHGGERREMWECGKSNTNQTISQTKTDQSIAYVISGTPLYFIKKQKLSYFGHIERHQTLGKLILEGKVKRQTNRGRIKGYWEKDVEDWMGASVWRVGQTAEDQPMWRSVWGQVSGEWDEQQKIAWCGGLDGGKCLESGTNSRRSPDVEDWMGASVWRVGQTAEDQPMWRSVWGQVSGEWDEQQKIAWCGGLDGGKCLESGTNSRRSADVEECMGASVWRVGQTAEDRLMWRTGWGQVSGEWDKQQKISRCGGVYGGKCLESGTNSRRSAGVYKIYQGSNIRKQISKRERKQKCCTMQERQSKWNILTSSSCSFWCFRCFHCRWICCAATCLRNSSTRRCVSCSSDVTDDERLWNEQRKKITI